MRKRSKGERKAFTVRLEPEAMEVLDRIASKYWCSYSYAINYLILKLSKHLLSESEKEPFPIVSAVKEDTFREGDVKKDSNNDFNDTN